MKRHDRYPSKYLKAEDLPEPVTLTIKAVKDETLKFDGRESKKPVLHFKETGKTFPLNVTNWDSIADITGEDDDSKWPDHRAEFYASTTEVRGDTKSCVRIRAPAQGELSDTAKKVPKSLRGDMDDEIPF